MANRSTNSDIIAYRDNAPNLTSRDRRAIRQDGESLLALAEARLTELAIRLALSNEARKIEVDDIQLVDFLKSDERLSDARRKTDEYAGDPEILERLAGLREALAPDDGEPVTYDRPLPLVSEVERLDLGTVFWRSTGNDMEFSLSSMLDAQKVLFQDSVHPEELSAALHANPDDLFFQEPERANLEFVLSNIQALEEALRGVIEVLARYRDILEHSSEPAEVGEATHAFSALNSRIEELRQQLWQYGIKGPRSLSPSMISRPRPRVRRAARPRPSSTEGLSFLLDRSLLAGSPQGSFTNRLSMDAGSSSIVLSGDAGSDNRINLSIADSRKKPWAKLLVTIVEDGVGFHSEETDEHGVANFVLGRWSNPTLMVGTADMVAFQLQHSET